MSYLFNVSLFTLFNLIVLLKLLKLLGGVLQSLARHLKLRAYPTA